MFNEVIALVILLFAFLHLGGLFERLFYFGTFFPKVKHGSFDKNGEKIKRKVSRLGDE